MADMNEVTYVAPIIIADRYLSFWIFHRDAEFNVYGFHRSMELHSKDQFIPYSYIEGVKIWRV